MSEPGDLTMREWEDAPAMNLQGRAWAELRSGDSRRAATAELYEAMFFGPGPSAVDKSTTFSPPGAGGELITAPLTAVASVFPMKREGSRDAPITMESQNLSVCAACGSKFGSIDEASGVPVTRNARNPFYCNSCHQFLEQNPGEAHGRAAVLAVDMEDSTGSLERDEDGHVEKLIRWKEQIARIVHSHWGFIHTSIGEHAMAIWFPGFLPPFARGDDHHSAAVRFALEAAHSIARSVDAVPFRLGLAYDNVRIFTSHAVSDVPIGPVLIDVTGRAVVAAADLADNRPRRPREARYVVTDDVISVTGTDLAVRPYQGAVTRFDDVTGWILAS